MVVKPLPGKTAQKLYQSKVSFSLNIYKTHLPCDCYKAYGELIVLEKATFD
jgi:hypothetical protein